MKMSPKAAKLEAPSVSPADWWLETRAFTPSLHTAANPGHEHGPPAIRVDPANVP
jgi:hypothetical protein